MCFLFCNGRAKWFLFLTFSQINVIFSSFSHIMETNVT